MHSSRQVKFIKNRLVTQYVRNINTDTTVRRHMGLISYSASQCVGRP